MKYPSGTEFIQIENDQNGYSLSADSQAFNLNVKI